MYQQLVIKFTPMGFQESKSHISNLPNPAWFNLHCNIFICYSLKLFGGFLFFHEQVSHE